MLKIKKGFRVLEEKDCEEIYQSALKILEEIGVRIENPRVLEAYKSEFGLESDSNLVVKFPRETVEKVLDRARKDYLKSQGEQNAEETKPIQMHMGYSSHKVVDMETGLVRPATREDLDKACIIGDALDELTAVPPLFFPKEVPPRTYALHTLKILLHRVRMKKLRYSIGEENLAKYVLDMLMVIYGSKKEVCEKIPSAWIPHRFVMSPLMLDKESMKIILEYYDLGLPVFLGSSMVIPGASGPISLAGSLALATAEQIICMFFNFLFTRGRKQVTPAGGGLTFIDQRTGINCYGGPDAFLCHQASADLNDYLGFSTRAYGFSFTDICIPNFQAGAEKMFGIMTGVFNGLPCYISCGWLGPGVLVGSLPQIIMDMEACKMANFFLKGIKVNKDTLALDLIKKVGIGGNFMTEEHTAKYFRSEVWLPEVFQRVSPDVWDKEKKDPVVEKAKEKVNEILKNHDPHYLSKEQEREMTKIIKKADEELG